MKEIRLIIFAADDLAEAIELWLRSRGEIDQYQRVMDPVLKGKNVDFTTESDIYDTRSKRIKRIVLNASDLKEVLILYCTKRGIPLSRRAVKKVQIYEDQATLVMSVGKSKT